MVKAVCKTCDHRIWRFDGGRVWYASASEPNKANRSSAVCLSNGGKHVAARGTVSAS